MRNYKHTLFYARDKEGTIHKSIGYTVTNEVVLAPKYVVDMTGDRIVGSQRYTALNFPVQSFQIVYADERKLKFSNLYGQFLPIFNRNEVDIFDPKLRLQERISEKSLHMQTIKKLLGVYSSFTNLGISDFGLDASLLCGLEKNSSDIDLLIYGAEKAMKCFFAIEKMKYAKCIESAAEERELYLYRRQPYSLMMTDEEILRWESRKISFVFDNIKVSVLPINDSMECVNYKYIPTGQFVSIRGYISKDQVVFEPGDIKFDKCDVIYGPNINIREIHTIIPVRTGVFLKKGDKIFATGMVYKKTSKDTEEYVLAQFPWDYYKFYKKTGIAFIIKIDLSQLSDNLYTNILKAVSLANL